MNRVRTSLGKLYHNSGIKLNQTESKFVLNHDLEFYIFDVIPIGAVRMTQSDKWKTNPNHVDPNKRQRKSVTEYFKFKNAIKLQAQSIGFVLPHVFEAVFFIPMPDSWSGKKKELMNGMPCKQKPDTDNCLKALKDALLDKDECVWMEKGTKYWAYSGSIIIFV